MNGGKPPEKFKRWQSNVFPDQEKRALRIVPNDTLEQLSDRVSEQLEDAKSSIGIIEGFLLYYMSDAWKRLDCKLFVRLDHHETGEGG